MTIVEKAAYLKGLVEGLGVEPESRDGKLWGALTDLLGEMAHEIDGLHEAHQDLSDALDEVSSDLIYVEELVDSMNGEPVDEDLWDDEEDEDESKVFSFPGNRLEDRASEDEDEDDRAEDEDEDEEYDGVVYDVTCPNCGEEISFDEDTLESGSIQCPNCGQTLQFDLGEDEPEEDGDR